MSKILILTSNLLAETALQQDLQKMNYEVFLSTSILKSLLKKSVSPRLLESFPVVILSEYLSEKEVHSVMAVLAKQNKLVIRRTMSETQKVSEQEPVSYLWSFPHQPLIELKQQIEDFKPYNQAAGAFEDDKIKLWQAGAFTPTEQTMIRLLYQQKGKLTTKEELCSYLWDAPITTSRRVQIYTLIGRIKEKLAQLVRDVVFIGSQRGNGYYLTDQFYTHFQLDSE